MIDQNVARARAEAAFVKKDAQRTDGHEAWQEYQAREAAITANIARLRALRLERDSQQQTAGVPRRRRRA